MKLIFFFSLFFLLLNLEFLLRKIIKSGRNKFQWLINHEDEHPKFTRVKLKKFIENSFDEELGWIRKPGTHGKEKSYNKSSTFKIDKKGSRYNPHNKKKFKKNIITFGDSFTFCRQVNNNQTWQAYLANNKKVNVLNYGVGNYGADQALILSKRIMKNKKFNISILGVVPETILRVNSCWKHYYEYGNIFGFKPRFIVKKDKLSIIKNPINNETKFKNYRKYLKKIQKNDYFYNYLFKKEIINKPYIIYFFKSLRNIKILFYIFFKKKNKTLEKFVLKKNHNISINFYKEKKSTDLLFKIVEEFFKHSRRNKINPVLIILPQIYDVEYYIRNNKTYYESFLSKFKNKSNIIDFTPIFAKKEKFNKYYINDKYGGHLSPAGNKLVSKILEKKINFN